MDLDRSIRDSYAARSNATLKNKLYDSYIRAIRWASLRIQDRGVIAFVTNGGFLDSNTADGMRLTLAEEFSSIHVLNLRGNARTAGDLRQREGGTVFDAGSRATVAITVLVKNSGRPGPLTVRYTDIGDYLTREEKLAKLRDFGSVGSMEPVVDLVPNKHGDWLNQRGADFGQYMPISDRKGGAALFELTSLGLFTSRDAWIYNFSAEALANRVQSAVAFYNDEVNRFAVQTTESTTVQQQEAAQSFVTRDPAALRWDVSLLAGVARGRHFSFAPQSLRNATYRPFTRTNVYFDRTLNGRVYQLPQLFPTPALGNVGIDLTGVGSHFDFCAIATDRQPDLHLLDTGQFFARWRYEAVADEGQLLFGAVDDDVVDGFRRVDNITDEALRRFREAYGAGISKDDIFHYVYGLLHSPDYRETYAADLKKILPRIPLVEDARPFVDAGRDLMALHLGYEEVEPYPLVGLEQSSSSFEFYRVKKMAFGKPTAEQRAAGERADKTTIIYNERIALTGVPLDAYRYLLGSRSAVEWIMDRYQVKTDKASGIVNDPNAWSREHDQPRYILDLLARIVTVSLETNRLVDALPPSRHPPRPMFGPNASIDLAGVTTTAIDCRRARSWGCHGSTCQARVVGWARTRSPDPTSRTLPGQPAHSRS